MKVLFITAHKYLPQMRGGQQCSTDQLCHELLIRGHKVSVAAGLLPGGVFASKARIKMQINNRLCGVKFSREPGLGYPVYFSWNPWETVEFVAEQERPDVIVVMAMQPVKMAQAVKSMNIPIIIQLQDVEFSKHGGDFTQIASLPCVANSNFTAERYREVFGASSLVIHPIIAREKYKTKTSRENVTFINPFPEKGREIALKIAQHCPEIPFAFIETWPLTLDTLTDLKQEISALPNVALLRPQSDMKNVYSKCKILLVPSIWEEAYGRVVTEAQMSGIPVVSSTRGGLPEAVGPGGLTLNPDQPIEEWAAAIRQLWQDQSYYETLSGAAAAHSCRPETRLDLQISAWEAVLLNAASSKNANSRSLK